MAAFSCADRSAMFIAIRLAMVRRPTVTRLDAVVAPTSSSGTIGFTIERTSREVGYFHQFPPIGGEYSVTCHRNEDATNAMRCALTLPGSNVMPAGSVRWEANIGFQRADHTARATTVGSPRRRRLGAARPVNRPVGNHLAGRLSVSRARNHLLAALMSRI